MLVLQILKKAGFICDTQQSMKPWIAQITINEHNTTARLPGKRKCHIHRNSGLTVPGVRAADAEDLNRPRRSHPIDLNLQAPELLTNDCVVLRICNDHAVQRAVDSRYDLIQPESRTSRKRHCHSALGLSNFDDAHRVKRR